MYLINRALIKRKITLAIVTPLLLCACKKSSITEPPPVISATSKQGYITSTTTVSSGDSVKIAWSAMRGSTELTKMDVLLDGKNFDLYNGGKTKELDVNNKFTFDDSVKFKALATSDLLFKISSTNSAASFSIRVIVPPNLNISESLMFDPLNSVWSSPESKVITTSDIESNKNNFDFLILLSSSKKIILSSILQAKLDGLIDKNGTGAFFKESELDFDALSPALLNGVNTEGASQTVELNNGKTYEYVNGRGKKGLIKINQIDVLGEGFNLKCSIKMQK